MPGQRRPFLAHALLLLALAAAAIFGVTRLTRVETAIGDVVITLQRFEERSFPAPAGAAARETAFEQLGPAAAGPPAAPRNVVLIIGDGMGIGHLSTASVLLTGPGGGLAIEAAPATALVKTSNGSELVPDSASAATSLATGFKTTTRMVSRLPDGREPRTLLEAAHEQGLATGMITTSGIVDATPAAFVAHAESRTDYLLILEGMLSSNLDILIGGDWRRYPRAAAHRGYVEAVQSVGSETDCRYTVVREEGLLASAPTPVLALFPARSGSRRSYGPPLGRTARFALERLSAASTGFVLVIESEDTDEAAHDTNLGRLIAAMAELEEAVDAVLRFAHGRDDTLVVVTADHDTGSLAIIDGEFSDPVAEVRWLTRGHTAIWVPLFAFGPGSDRFRGVLDGTEVPRIIGRLLALDGFPDANRNTPLVD